MLNIVKSPLFLLGLLLRVGLVLLAYPKATQLWYAPFMDLTTHLWSVDPWGAYLAHAHSSLAFPYGYVMWLIFMPLVSLGKLCHIAPHFTYGLTLVLADFCLFLVLHALLSRLLERNLTRFLIITYWLSPILILATYWFGFNDLIPVFLVCSALFFTQRYMFFWAGLLLALGISAKLSTALAFPFFLIYLIRNKAIRTFLPSFLLGFFPAFLVLTLPTLMLPSAKLMLFQNPELGKIYQFSLPMGNHTSLYVLPFFYLLLLYGTWRIKRLNFELFETLLGLSFLGLVLLTPAALGWFIWILPMFVLYQSQADRLGMLLTSLFALLYAGNALLPNLPLPPLDTDSLFRTSLFALGFILAVRIWRETHLRNDYFKLSQRPFCMGISGDSGAGKDTLVEAMTGLFGKHSVAALSGDDYHLWDRHKPMWQVMTHLNPRANHLEQFTADVLELTQRRAISLRHYDHKTGKMTRPFRLCSNDFIFVSGLHALFLPSLRKAYHLSIYLDIDENLRQYYKLKRDVGQRGHSVQKVLDAMKRREPDAALFIHPQMQHADLVFSLQPVRPEDLSLTAKFSPKVKLFVRSRLGMDEVSLVRVLVGVAGLHVDMDPHDLVSQDIAFTVEGDPSPEDIELAAKLLLPKILPFLDPTPLWQPGALGLMQLITAFHINQALIRSFTW